MIAPAALETLRELPRTLVAAGYADVLATKPFLSLSGQIAADLEVMPPRLATLVELWFLRRSIPRERVEHALSDRSIDDLLGLGVLVSREDTISTMNLVMLSAAGHLVLVPSPAKLPAAYFGIEGAVLFVRMLASRESALVLGAGPGVHSAHAASRSNRVVAVESDPIAHACAELNAAMNDLDNVELRRGPIHAPDLDEQFSRIYVSAPTHPIPIQPTGVDGPAILDRVLQRLPELLRPHGVAQLVGVWHGTDAGPSPSIDLEELSARGFSIAATVVARHALHAGTPLFEAFVRGIASERRVDPSSARSAAIQYLAKVSATQLYLVSMTVSTGPPRVELSRHWTQPGGEWQR